MSASAAPLPPGQVAARRTLPAISTRVGSPIQITVGAILAILYLLALGARQDSIALGLILMGACLAVVWPASGLAMFVVIMPMREPEILAPGRFNAILAGAITLGCIVRLPIDRLPLRVHPGIVLLIGYLVISALSIVPILSGHPSDWIPSALNILLRLSTGVALFLSAIYLFRLMSPWPILGLALLGVTLNALLALGDILDFLPLEGLTRGLVEDTGSLRASGAFADPNFLGLYAAIAAVLGLGLLTNATRPLKLFLVPMVILLFACVALSYSRGASLSVLAGIVVLIGLRNRLAGLLLLLAATILVVFLYPAFLEARQGGALSPSDSYAMVFNQETRATMATAALAMFADFPIFGVGFGVFQFVSASYVSGGAPDSTYSHNQYLNILAEQGLVGAILVAVLITLLTVALIRSRSPLRATTLAMGATYLVASFFLHTATVFQSSSLIWLVLAATLAPGPERADHARKA